MTGPKQLFQLAWWLHGAALLAAFGGFQVIKGRLDALYAASNHPVDYATGQTTFDAERIRGFYDVMQKAGTLEVYVQTQQFDYVFMIALALFGACLATFCGRMARDGSLGRRFGLWGAWAAILGAVCDALENAVSFVMLANPDSFADWLALPYSGFAALKFGLITLAILGCILALASAGLGRVLNRPKLG